jgi:hypothetical protein
VDACPAHVGPSLVLLSAPPWCTLTYWFASTAHMYGPAQQHYIQVAWASALSCCGLAWVHHVRCSMCSLLVVVVVRWYHLSCQHRSRTSCCSNCCISAVAPDLRVHGTATLQTCRRCMYGCICRVAHTYVVCQVVCGGELLVAMHPAT